PPNESPGQKMIFSPNCRTRFGSPVAMTVAELGREAVMQQVWPKALLVMVAEPLVELRGFSKFGWFKTLKASARNWILICSVTSKFLAKPESRFHRLGPWNKFLPLPFCPGPGIQK